MEKICECGIRFHESNLQICDWEKIDKRRKELQHKRNRSVFIINLECVRDNLNILETGDGFALMEYK